jgi:Anaphase-promoting complex APC subunit CDC26
MLRRQPTAITLTNEDILKFEEDRKRKLAQRNMENAFDGSKSRSHVEKPLEKPRQKTANDRILGSGSGS